MVVMDVDGKQYWKFKPTSKDENYLDLVGPFDAKSGMDHKNITLSQYIVNHYIHYIKFLEQEVVGWHDIFLLLHDFTCTENDRGHFSLATYPFIKINHTKVQIKRKVTGHYGSDSDKDPRNQTRPIKQAGQKNPEGDIIDEEDLEVEMSK